MLTTRRANIGAKRTGILGSVSATPLRALLPTALFLVSCRSASPVSPAPPAAIVHVASPVSSSQASVGPSATTPTTAPPPLPKLDTPELQDRLLFLSTICRPAVKRDDKGVQHVGCTSCAPFEGPEDSPDGSVAVDPELFYELRVLLRGSFSRPGVDEAAATLDGCEPHAANYGGTLLAERTNGAWSAVRYDSGVNPAACIVYRRKDGRDILVCEWRDGHQSRWHDRVFTYDFAESTADDVEKGWHTVVEMNDDSIPGCWGSIPGEPITRGAVDDYKLVDFDKNGEVDLVATVSQIKGKPSKAYKTKCDELMAAMDQENGPAVDVAAALGPRKTYVLQFVFNGTTFVPTKASAKIMQSL